jgi:signal transduction histidine kinase
MEMGDRSRILIIDDDPLIRKTLSDILSAKGYELTVTSYGAEGLAIARQCDVDIVLVDLKLPDISGLDVLQGLKQTCPQVEAIVLTGHATLDSAIDATNRGAFSYLQKPYEIEQLLLLIGQAVDKQMAEKAISRLASFPRLDPDVIIETDTEGTVTYTNPAAGRIFPDLRSLGCRHPMIAAVKPVLNTLMTQQGHKLVLEVPAGGMVYEQHMWYVPELNLIRIYAIDITERKRMEKELEMHRSRLEELVRERTRELELARMTAEAANRAKSEFIGNMSHEVRTPLNAIMGFSDLLADGVIGPITDKQKEYLQDISESGRRLLSLINDILDLSRIEDGGAELALSDFDLGELLDRCMAFFRKKAVNCNVRTVLDVEKGIGKITADKIKVKQAVLNLLNNALTFTPGGGIVRLSARRDFASAESSGPGLQGSESRPMVEIRVEDTGIGIAKEDQERLFKPFELLEDPITKKHGGLGIGLYLARRNVELHGGSIRVESEKGKGSKFVIAMPVEVRQPEIETARQGDTL